LGTHDSAVAPALRRVLVADADGDTLALYRSTFQTTACDVIEAVDGRDALVKAFTNIPSLVLMELRLPLIDGFDLCELLRRDYQTRSVPILVITGESRRAELDRAYQKGADLVLVKPVTPHAILDRSRSLVQRAADAQTRSSSLRSRTAAAFAKSKATVARGRERQLPRSRRLERFATTSPPLRPRDLRCPSCDRELKYLHTYVGGVNETQVEQWDTFTCVTGCGTFEYRHRTRMVRRLSESA
jgi:DNA-binding response OmpR family regulator